jgi:predicted nucleic acid-binding protein
MVTKAVTYLKVNYLDASAAVRLTLEEPGYEHLRNYFNDEDAGSFRITSICLAETLAVLKRKWRREQLSEKDYFDKCYVLLAYVRGKPKSIQVDDIQLSDLNVFVKTQKIAQLYGLDLSDALQLVTVKQRFGALTGKSKPLLITADRDLASAAEKEGIRVWNCLPRAASPSTPS